MSRSAETTASGPAARSSEGRPTVRSRTLESAAQPRLLESASFALHRMSDGRSYVARETEPYEQYWLSERERLLLALFGARRGATLDEALDALARLEGRALDAVARRRLARTVADMRTAGVLQADGDDRSRYTAAIVAAYRRNRPFPRVLADRIVQDGAIGLHSAVLDLAGGTGDLALALARQAGSVTMMDLSRGFTQTARRRARRAGLALQVIEDSCNRLASHDAEYDVVTIAQALHWMDDVQVCRGICRVLRPGGSFFVVQGAFEVHDDHPLAWLLGPKSVLGERSPHPFAQQARALVDRLTLLFQALDTPEVQRVDRSVRRAGQAESDGARIVPSAVQLFRQSRPLDEGFVRAFVTPQHIAASGLSEPEFWGRVQHSCAGRAAPDFQGRYDWSLLQWRRGGEALTLPPADALAPATIGWEPGSTD